MKHKKTIDTFEQFGESFQQKLAYLITRDSSFADQIQEVLSFNFFEHKNLQVYIQKIFEYKLKYKVHPSLDTIKTILKSDLDKENEMLGEQIKEFFSNFILSDKRLEDAEYVKDKSLDFCKKQKLREAMLKSIDLLQKSSFDEISVEINNALKAGTDLNFGHEYVRDFEKRYEERQRNPISTGWPEIDNITQGGLGGKELGVIIAPPGCHARGTKIVMFNGEMKNVEDIIVGDVLMGPNSEPRAVLGLVRGCEQMYEIKPLKGNSFEVNESHILSLVRYWWKDNHPCGDRKIINISLKDYLNKSNTFKHISKLYYSPCIEFENNNEDFLLDPYILGLLIGDGFYYGYTPQVSFTNMDDILLEEIERYMLSLNLDLKVSPYQKKNNKAKTLVFVKKNGTGRYNKLYKLLEKIGIRKKGLKEKFIPKGYLITSKENRLKLLAGLIDTDGYLRKGSYEITTKFKRLNDDIVFLCKSLGFYTYSRIKKVKINGKILSYYRISFYGEKCNEIPCKLERKICFEERKQKKNCMVTGFDVIKKNKDFYYGFQLDGDHLYLTNDFLVHHNCGKSFSLVHLTAAAMKQNKNVIYYSMELSDEYVGKRVDSSITEFPLDDLRLYKDIIRERIKNISGSLIIKEYPTKSISLKSIRNHLDKVGQRGFVPDLIVLDYLDLLKPISYTKEKRYDLESISEDLRAIAQERKIPIWTASQCHRDSMEKEVITMASIAESFNKVFCADFIMSLSRTIQDKSANTGRFYIAKSRLGVDGITFNLFVDTSISKIKVLPSQNEDEKLVIDSPKNGELSDSNKKKYKELLRDKSKK